MASAWQCLGFINDLDSYLGSKLYIENDSDDEDTIVNNTQVIDDEELNQVRKAMHIFNLSFKY